MKTEEDLVEKVFKLVQNQIQDETDKVVEFADAKTILDEIPIEITQAGDGLENLPEYIKKYLHYSVKTGNKMFQNQLYQGFNVPAFIGEVVTAYTNTSMYTYEVAPVATLMEIELIRKMCQAIGYSNGDGVFVTGGSNANMIAMLTARNTKFPEFRATGSQGKVFTAFLNKDAHYSFKNAANMLGIGSKNLHLIETDDKGRMLPEALNMAIVESKSRGEIPFFIGATAATTMRAAYDPLLDLSKIAKEHGLWLHMDGSFGGSIVLSNKYKSLVEGIEEVDSVAWNPHKLMNIPLVCSVILVKQKGRLEFNIADVNTDYIYHENDTQQYDLGKKSVQCGRRVDALKLWCAWKCLGDDGYANRIDTLIENAMYFESKVKESKDMELLADRQSFAVCFRVKSNALEVNDFNIQLREEMRKSGELLLNYGYVDGKVAFRFVSVNPEISHKDIDRMFEVIQNTAKKGMNATLN